MKSIRSPSIPHPLTGSRARASRGRSGVRITVADTGEGIAPSTLSNMFKAFYTTKGAHGTGLGLWISTEIIQRHHGRLRVRSSRSEGRHGTIFQLFLPFQAAAGENTVHELQTPTDVLN